MNSVQSNDYWKEKLTPEQFSVCRMKATEPPFSGKYVHHTADGMYVCVACKNPLFSSGTKFESFSGWPSFYDVANKGNVELKDDSTRGMKRTEVLCATCGSHLGHVFPDGPPDKGGQRYCINSASLDFQAKK